MAQYDFNITVDMRLTVPDAFVEDMLLLAHGEGEQHLKKLFDGCDGDTDNYIAAVLANGLQRHVRDSLMSLARDSGFGLAINHPEVAHSPQGEFNPAECSTVAAPAN